MKHSVEPLDSRWERAVWRAHRGDKERCWLLILVCGHTATRHRLELPPTSTRCAKCAKEKP